MKNLILQIRWAESVRLSKEEVENVLNKTLGNLFGNANGVFSVSPNVEGGEQGADAEWSFRESLNGEDGSCLICGERHPEVPHRYG